MHKLFPMNALTWNSVSTLPHTVNLSHTEFQLSEGALQEEFLTLKAFYSLNLFRYFFNENIINFQHGSFP